MADTPLQTLASENLANADLTNKMSSISASTSINRRPVDKNSRKIPLKSDTQRYVALNIAHTNQACKSRVAMFRILGAFPSSEEIAEKYKNNNGPPIYNIPMWQWFPITKSPVKEEDAAKRQEETVQRVKALLQKRADDAVTVVENATDEKADERYDSALKLREKTQQLEDFLNEDDETFNKNTTPTIDRNMEVRNQRYACVSIICDPDPNDEPLICFCRFFDSKEEAHDYNRNTIHTAEIATDTFVVDLYEWVNPLITLTRKFQDSIPASFSHSQLEQLHEGRKWEQGMIEKIMRENPQPEKNENEN